MYLFPLHFPSLFADKRSNIKRTHKHSLIKKTLLPFGSKCFDMCAYTSLRWHYPTGSSGLWRDSHTLSLISQAPDYSFIFYFSLSYFMYRCKILSTYYPSEENELAVLPTNLKKIQMSILLINHKYIHPMVFHFFLSFLLLILALPYRPSLSFELSP